MAKNGCPFCETAVTLTASLPAPMQIRLRQALQMSPPQGLTEPKFGLSHLWQHTILTAAVAGWTANDGAQPRSPSVVPLRPMA